jgi:hypothetical protein
MYVSDYEILVKELSKAMFGKTMHSEHKVSSVNLRGHSVNFRERSDNFREHSVNFREQPVSDTKDTAEGVRLVG